MQKTKSKVLLRGSSVRGPTFHSAVGSWPLILLLRLIRSRLFARDALLHLVVLPQSERRPLRGAFPHPHSKVGLWTLARTSPCFICFANYFVIASLSTRVQSSWELRICLSHSTVSPAPRTGQVFTCGKKREEFWKTGTKKHDVNKKSEFQYHHQEAAAL